MGLQMKNKQAVTREYAPRYQKAGKKEKSNILDHFTTLTGYNRKYAIRVLNAATAKPKVTGKPRPANRRGKRLYTDEVIDCLRLIWEFFHWKCGKLLAPLIRQQMAYIAAWKPFNITPEVKAKLLKISPARIDYYLRPDKAALRIKGKSLTKPLNGLKSRIPIRTFYTSEERKTPGFIQIDTVHHCGQFTKGEYNLTLTATDVFSGWINLYSLLNKAFTWTFEALKDITNTLPFPLVEFHSDNGAEFINHATEKWCTNPEHPVPFTRSRDHQKNDNAFVEQKNGAVVREYVGYYRLENAASRELLAAVYRPLVPLLNFFMPTMKLIGKTRIGAKEIKKYDKPQSPYQRLMDCPALDSAVKERLKAASALYNPVALQHDANRAILALFDAVVHNSKADGQ